MRIRHLVAGLVAGIMLVALGALVAPASADRPPYGHCRVTLIQSDGDMIYVNHERPIECYY